MSKKVSSLWNYFDEDVNDHTNVVCKIADCGKTISRGKAGSARSNTGMRCHLKTCHAREWQEFLSKEKDQDGAKAAADEDKMEADETEHLGVPIFDLRSQKKRKSFFQQNLPDMVQLQETYDIKDERAKSKYRGILTYNDDS